ncbi:cell surface glycoprotein (s-layer protein)-like protein [Anaeramoeba flamelloides]|uniref:Cell surface glycoprotein (S-layer protein)-like protein n=1 Tax=Anaeramoeba flamelloides TaxID=1746091 RepID=A0AAV7YJM9_9EUKA|nr:cell surface glycoprotein (s-layer protein)-like protein [Anaeramoeba flamelloides]
MSFHSQDGFIDMKIKNGDLGRIEGYEKLKSHTTIMKGKGNKKTYPNYRVLRYEKVLSGVDLQFELENNHLKSSFFLEKGKQMESIEIEYDTPFEMSISKNGDLEFRDRDGMLIVREYNLIFLQQNQELEGRFLLDSSKKTISFQIDDPLFNPELSLVIDPNYATYVGGSNDDSKLRIVSDIEGSVYGTGKTWSSDFPISGDAKDEDIKNNGDAFLFKLDKDQKLIYSTYIGSYVLDYGASIGLDSNNNPIAAIYTKDYTSNTIMETTQNAYKENCDGLGGGAFIVKMNSDGSDYLWSTFICSDDQIEVLDLKVDSDDNVFLTGTTFGRVPPTGETATNYRCPANGGEKDTFIAALDDSGNNLLGSNCITGDDDDLGYAIDLSPDSIYIAGTTSSTDLSDTTGRYMDSNQGGTDCFVAKFQKSDFVTQWATYVGGDLDDKCQTLSLDTSENIWVGGSSLSVNFPTTTGSYQEDFSNSVTETDAVFFELNNEGDTLLYGSYLGVITSAESADQILVDKDDLILIGGFGNPFAEYDFSFGEGGYVALFESNAVDLYKTVEIACSTFLSLENFNNTNWDWVSSGNLNTDLLDVSSDPFQRYQLYQDNWIIALEMNCGLGSYGTRDGCILCEPGTFTNETLQNQCIKCGLGYHSSNNGSTECLECEKGSYSDVEGLGDCKLCDYGTYNPSTGSTSSGNCIACPVGTYNPNQGSFNAEEGCLDCPAGTFNVNLEGKSLDDCNKCPAGTYNPHTRSNSSSVCQDCETGTVSDSGSSSCTHCGIGEEPSSIQDKCESCEAGYYASEEGLSRCTKCPDGEFNNEEGQSSCLKCTNEHFCLGGNSCGYGRDNNNYCNTCVEGYFTLNSNCRECLHGSIVWIVVVVVLVVILILYFLRNTAVLEYFNNPLFGIALTGLQLVGLIISFDLDYPTGAQGFFRYFTSIFILDFWSMSSQNCHENFTFYHRWLLMFLLPFIFSFIFLIYVLIQSLKKEGDTDLKYNFMCSCYFKYTTALKYLYIPYLKICFDTFDSTYYEIIDARLLDADPNINTSSSKYKSYLAGFVIGLIIYVVGIPAVFAYILLKARSLLFAEDYNDKHGWIYMKYKENRYWFEMVEFLFKFLLAISSVMFKPKTEGHTWYLFAMFAVFLILFAYLRPHAGDYPRFVPEDKVEIGFYIIAWSMLSLAIDRFNFLIFILLYPTGFVFAFIGYKEYVTNYWYDDNQNKEKNQNEIEMDEMGENNNDEDNDETSSEDEYEVVQIDDNLTEYEKNAELLKIRRQKNDEMAGLREELDEKEDILKIQNEENFQLKNENKDLLKLNKKLRKKFDKIQDN